MCYRDEENILLLQYSKLENVPTLCVYTYSGSTFTGCPTTTGVCMYSTRLAKIFLVARMPSRWVCLSPTQADANSLRSHTRSGFSRAQPPYASGRLGTRKTIRVRTYWVGYEVCTKEMIYGNYVENYVGYEYINFWGHKSTCACSYSTSFVLDVDVWGSHKTVVGVTVELGGGFR